ncbi:hypothetical protein BKA69DRAFT_1123619 [Paraphysoderma sedebokerense]|nr:hypothetical protein BKA69DRAFT_1123619 [Paraphysoderma sedebokerense]
MNIRRFALINLHFVLFILILVGSVFTAPVEVTTQQAFRGIIIHSKQYSNLEILEDGVLGINEFGKIVFLANGTEADALLRQHNISDKSITKLQKGQFIIPGFVDTHTHIPQYVFIGTCMDLPLLDWLKTYTFPREAEFNGGNKQYAQMATLRALKRYLKSGTTTATYFSSIYLEHIKIVADQVEKQRAYVGQVNMDRNSPDYYIKETTSSIRDTETFINYVLSKKNSLITPVVTPRFVPTCTAELMQALGVLANKYYVPIQSHISENRAEVKWVAELHPDIANDERALFKARGAGISHCPNSNLALPSGILNVRQVMEEGVKVGLGTDVSGGFSVSNHARCHAHGILSSKLVNIISDAGSPDNKRITPLTVAEVFHLATVGSAEVMGLSDTIGNFEPGKEFDALLIDTNVPDSPFDLFPHDDTFSTFEKFVFNGDDRNIVKVYVKGKVVSGRDYK